MCINSGVAYVCKGFPDSSVGKESPCNAGDPGSIPGLGRSPREGKGYPLQCSGLENSVDCIVHGVAKNRTRLSDFHFTSLHIKVCSFSLHQDLPPNPYLEKRLTEFPCLRCSDYQRSSPKNSQVKIMRETHFLFSLMIFT